MFGGVCALCEHLGLSQSSTDDCWGMHGLEREQCLSIRDHEALKIGRGQTLGLLDRTPLDYNTATE